MAEPGGETPVADTGPQTFTFHLPDGKSASISAPRGTSTEQAWGYLTTQHPEYAKGQGQGSGQTEQLTQGATRPSLPAVLSGVSPPVRPENDPGAAIVHGALGTAVEGGRLLNYPAQQMGWDLSKLVPPSMQRGWDRLTEQANKGGGSQISEDIGSALPFAFTGPLEGVPWAAKVAGRSILPAILQPTQGPIDPTQKLEQVGIGLGAGEGLHWISRLAKTPLGKWALEELRQIAGPQKNVQQDLQRTISARAPQLTEIAAQQSKRAAEEKAQQEAFATAKAEHEKATAEAAAVEKRNLERRQAVEKQNAQGEREYEGARAQHQIDTARQLDMPRQATQGLLNDARGLIGQRPLEYNLTRESAPQALRDVGDELNRIYGGMSFDPNRGGWLGTAQKVQQDIRNRLRQDPRAQALWDQVFQDKAFMPGLRAEAGEKPGWDIMHGNWREPAVRGPSLPMGTRSGEVTGDQLGRLMSTLTKAQQQFGLEAQRGGGLVYKDMAAGLRQMRESIERQLDSRFPKLAEQRQAANQAYFLTSRVMDAIDVHGAATPERLLQAFKDAEGDTRFGTDKRFADIKDRLESQHQQYSTPLEKPTPPTAIKGYDEPVPKVGKPPTAPTPSEPKPVPLRVPRRALNRPPVPVSGTSRVSPEAAHLAGHAAAHLAGATGIPGARPAAGAFTRHVLRNKEALRRIRDTSRRIASPAAAAAASTFGGKNEEDE